jgi:hypothetical protein
MRNGDVARLVRMLELPVITFTTNPFPAVGFESLEDIDATHVVYAYTPCCDASRAMREEWG